MPVLVPTGCFQAPFEFLALQNEWILQDKFRNIVSFSKAEIGGHFAAFEIPEILAPDVVKFITGLENSNAMNK